MISVGIETQGFKELERILAGLPVAVENRVLQSATRGAMQLAKPALVAAAPKSTTEKGLAGMEVRSINSRSYGQLHRNLKVENKRRKRQGARGAALTTGDAFWGNFLEKGTRYIDATFWFSNAFRRVNAMVLEELRKRISSGIDKEIKKL